MKQTFIIQPDPHPSRQRALAALSGAPVGNVVTIGDPPKNRGQECLYHALIGEIAESTTYIGKAWSEDDMKRILLDEFTEEMRLAGTPLDQHSRIIPSENGQRVIQLGTQSHKFTKGEASQFIEFLHAWLAQRT